MEVDPSDPNHLLAGSFGNVIAESHDAGGSWSTQYLDGNSYGLSRIALAFSSSDPTVVYAMAGKVSNQGFAGIWRSTDGGGTWDAQALEGAGPNLLGWTVDGADAGGQAWYDLCLAVDPTNSDKLYAGGVNLWTSSDAGVTNGPARVIGMPEASGPTSTRTSTAWPSWTMVDSSSATMVAPSPTTRQTDEAEDHSAGLAIAQAYRVDMDPLAMDRFIAGTQDNGTFLKHDGQWEHVLGGDGFACAFHGEVEDVVYASLYYGQVFRSDDGGNAFVEIAGNAGGGVDSQGAWLTPWAVSRFNPDWVYVAKDRVYRSTNRGEDWTALGDIPNGECTALGLCPSDVSPHLRGQGIQACTAPLTDKPSTCWTRPMDFPGSRTSRSMSPMPTTCGLRCPTTTTNTRSSKAPMEETRGRNLSDGLPEAPVNCIAPRCDRAGCITSARMLGFYRLDPAEWRMGAPFRRIAQCGRVRPRRPCAVRPARGRHLWAGHLHAGTARPPDGRCRPRPNLLPKGIDL